MSSDPPIAATRFLVAAARRVAGSVTADGGGSRDGSRPHLDTADLDWSVVLREALRHGVLPLLHRDAEAHPGLMPEVVARDLERTFDEGRRRNLRLAAELVAVVRELERNRIPSVPWKGPLLAERAYGNLAMRTFYDLDLLVQRPHLEPAAEILGQRGFRAQTPAAPALQARYIAQQGELELLRDDDPLLVELHWAVVPNYYAPPRDDGAVADIWRRLVPARVGRAEVRALAIEDEFEALCVHGSKHRWDRLMWIVDLAMVVQSQPDLDWDALLERARRHGTLRMVHLGLRLAVDVCGATLPSGVVEEVRADLPAGMLAREVQRGLVGRDAGRLAGFVFHARMRDRASHQARYALSVLFTPSGGDWTSYALPERLWPLYGVLRPLRLLRQYGLGFVRSRLAWR